MIDSKLTLQSFLFQWNRKIVTVTGDGNCLFRVVSYLLFQNENAHDRLREIILRFEYLNKSLFENRMTNINENTFDQHLRKLCDPRSWATHIEVYAIATYFQAPVYFVTEPPEQGTAGRTYCWECFRPLSTEATLSYPVLIPDDISLLADTKPTHFELVYYTRLHYDCIIPLMLFLYGIW